MTNTFAQLAFTLIAASANPTPTPNPPGPCAQGALASITDHPLLGRAPAPGFAHHASDAGITLQL